MDREMAHSNEMKQIDRAGDIGIGVEEIGTTSNPFQHQTEALKARIFHGASRVEMAFFGAGKGRKEQPTPETFGRRERMDMRELAEFNKVETTTHATVGIQGLSGLNMQQQVFSDDQRKQAIDEIKRAIHFAAEATTGGAIVFHTGEAPRSFYSQLPDNKQNGDKLFEMYPDEGEREQFFLADPLTKRVVGVKRNDLIPVPIVKEEKGEFIYLKGEDGKPIVDETLKKYDKVHGGKTPIYQLEKDGTIKVKLMRYNDWVEHRKEEYEKAGQEKPLDESEYFKDFFRTQSLNQVQYYMNFGRFSKGAYEKILEAREKTQKALKFYQDLKKNVPKEDWWKYQHEGPRNYFIPPNVLDPVEYLEETLSHMERDIQRQTEYDIMGKRQSMETLEMVERLKPASDFAVEESSKSMADLGVYTWQMSERAKKKQGDTQFKLKNDLYLAPENLFPEMYGSHPDELRKLVVDGRQAMAKELESKYGKDKKEAEKLAEKHIKATFDIGHVNIWRKYFKSKPEESLEDRDKRFNTWLLGKTEKLIKDGIVGHIHISDNYGFNDEHLTAGDGNAPIKEFVKQAKAKGFSEFIVESGSFNPMTSLPDSWMHFNSPVYGVHVAGFTHDSWTDPTVKNAWGDVYRSYFGKTEGPRYLVGDLAPSEEFKGAPFYSGLGLE
ncbi:MAG: hypothetical protein AABW92_03600 [Nanoarchaeota archaeon]